MHSSQIVMVFFFCVCCGEVVLFIVILLGGGKTRKTDSDDITIDKTQNEFGPYELETNHSPENLYDWDWIVFHLPAPSNIVTTNRSVESCKLVCLPLDCRWVFVLIHLHWFADNRMLSFDGSGEYHPFIWFSISFSTWSACGVHAKALASRTIQTMLNSYCCPFSTYWIEGESSVYSHTLIENVVRPSNYRVEPLQLMSLYAKSERV